MKNFPPIAGLLVASLGSLVILGFELNVNPSLPGLITMKANTALCFILTGLSLWLIATQLPSPAKWAIGLVRGGASLVTLIAGLTLSEILFGLDFGLDQLFFTDPSTIATQTFRPGQMTPMTAVNFIFAGCAFWLVTVKNRVSLLAIQWLGYAMLVISFLVILSNAYQVQPLHTLDAFIIMALPTAVSFILLAGGILSLFPQTGLLNLLTSEGIGSYTARRLILVSMITLPIVGWLRIQVTQHELLGVEASVVLLVASASTIIVILIWYSADSLNAAEARIKQNEYQILHLNRFHAILHHVNQAIVSANERQLLFQDSCRILVEYGNFRMVWIGMVDKHSQLVLPVAKAGVEEGYLDEIKISVSDNPEGRGPTGSALREGKPLVCADFEQDPRMIPWREKAVQRGYRSSAALPIRVQNQLVGVLTLYAPTVNFFDEVELNSLNQVVDNIAYALALGKEVGLWGLVHEIAERKRVEEALQKSEERFELAMRGANDGLWDWNLETNEAYFSPRWKQMLGFADAELTNSFTEWQKLLHPADHDLVLREIDAYLDREIPVYEQWYRMQHKDGHDVWILARAMAVWNQQGTPIRLIGTQVDMTVQKQTEESLRQVNLALTQFKTSLDMTLDSVFMLDAETLQFIYANQGAIKQVGYSQAELLQMRVSEIKPEFPEEQFRCSLLAPLVEGTLSSQRYETVHRHKEGRLIPVEVLLQYIPLSDQRSCLVKIARDITEHKQIEANLREAKQAAEIANRAKSAFLSNMSHELRTPLNGIWGFAQILQRDSSLSVTQQEQIAVIQRCSEYLLTLITDILDLSKIEADRLEPVSTTFHLESFLKGVTELFAMRTQQKGLAFSYDQLSHLPAAVHADEKRLRQILLNLLGNAVKFTEKGGVTLKVGYYHDHIRFQVTDTGPGIAQTDLERIFLPFQQVGDSSYHAQGTGLGLTITKKLVEMMGGKLQVISTLQMGSTFWFAIVLPEVADVSTANVVESPVIIGYQKPLRAGEVATKFKILIVDDKWENRAFVSQLLTSLDFDITEASDGRSAVATAQQWHPDVILMDLVMPIMDGFTATRRIRKIPGLEKVILIAMSASVFDCHQQESNDAGCNDFIAKPFRLEILLDRLQQHLHLTWIYEQPKIATPANAAPQTGASPEEIPVVPSVEQLTTLANLAKCGDITGILDYMGQLEQTDPQLLAFTTKISQMAKGFQKRQILELIKPYLG